MATATDNRQPTTAVELVPAQPSAPLTPLDLIVRAQEQHAPPELLDKYLALYERWRETEAKRSFANAIAAAQAEIPVIQKNRQVDYPGKTGQVRYRHEDLAEIERTIKPVLARHGLGYRWRTKVEGTSVLVTCVVSHREGHCEETTLPGSPDNSGSKNSIQALGSTVTFLQRYTLKAALGLAAAEDDDGRGARNLDAASRRTPNQAASTKPAASAERMGGTAGGTPSNGRVANGHGHAGPVTGEHLANPRGTATLHPHARSNEGGRMKDEARLPTDLAQFRDLARQATMVNDVLRAAADVRRGRMLSEVEASLLTVWTDQARDRIKSSRGERSNAPA